MWITYLLLILLAVSITALALWISLKPTHNKHIDSNPTQGSSNTSTIPAAITPTAAPQALLETPVVQTERIKAITGDSSSIVLSPSRFSSPNAFSTPLDTNRLESNKKLGSPIPFPELGD